jgi:hypothetical protein
MTTIITKLVLFAMSFLSVYANPVPSAYVVTSASYLVPTAKNLEALSHFIVQVNTAYQGSQTTEMSYTFPLELTGVPLTVSMTRVPGTENDWEGPLMKASCGEIAKIITCAMSFMDVTKSQSLVDRGAVQNLLIKQGISSVEIADRLKVIEDFISGEPAGVLIYKYRP